MGLKSRIKNYYFTHEYVQEPRELEKAVIEAQWNFTNILPRQPADFSLVDSYHYLNNYYQAYGSFTGAKKSSLRKLPWLLFESIQSDCPALSLKNGLLAEYLNCLKSIKDDRQILLLCWVFLRDYPVRRKCFDELCDDLPCLLSLCESKKGISFRNLAIGHRLFEPDAGDYLAEKIYGSELDLTEFFNRCGLNGECAYRGLAEHVLLKFLSKYRFEVQESDNPVVLDHLLNYCSLDNDQGGNFRFPHLKKQIAEALLLPYVKRWPDNNKIQDTIKKFLLKHFGDPRFEVGGWHSVSEAAINVMLSFMAENTLEDFFDILSLQSRRLGDTSRHWKYRKAFWLSYLKRGYLTEAWVGIANGMLNSLDRDRFEQLNNLYGSIKVGGNVDDTHAVLIMRIGSFIVVDWNHNRACRLWYDDDEFAPELYAKKYTWNSLTQKAMQQFNHSGNETGAWQGKISSFFRDEQGMVVPFEEYMNVR